ncbi:muscle calcium channel subunit alpha-1-like [Salminus brasiliensis]|uniref:muscle calcium channel subunit alpha-1-like n=1 Tax=Salminus brasiliensis TaxID=930266 RepID=UPI003B82D7B7
MEDRGELTSSSRMSRLGCYFRAFMVLVVVLDAAFMGLETDRELKTAYSALFEGADVFYLVVFILEFMVKVYTEPCGFWGSGANICNTGFLLLSLISRADGSYWVFRILRAFRILRIIFIIPSIQDLVLILFQGLKTAAYVTAMIFFILLVFAVAGVQHFGTADPENWGDMGVALLSTLSVVTISGWLEHQDRLHSLGIAYSELFFIILILIGNFMFLNMFTGLVMASFGSTPSFASWPPGHSRIQQGSLAKIDPRSRSSARICCILARSNPLFIPDVKTRRESFYGKAQFCEVFRKVQRLYDRLEDHRQGDVEMEDRGELTSSSRMSRLGCYFRAFMVLVVVLDAAFMGLETDRELKTAYSALFEGADVFYLVVFILEFMVKVYTEPCGFWGSGANICNTGFLLLSLISRADGSYWVFRILRAFRILRIIFIIPSIQDLVLILFQGLKTAAYVTAMIFFILLVFAVAGVQHFGTADPENWGDMGVALLSTLSVVTISGWLEHQDRLHSLGIAYSELFFIILILIGNFMFLNMFTGLVMAYDRVPRNILREEL